MFWCRHKYGKVSAGNYQYCTKCGKVNVIPCQHKFTTIKETERCFERHGTTYVIGARYTLRCDTCGILKEVETGRNPND